MPGQLDAIVSVAIEASAATPTVPNFGIPAILAYHSHNTDYVRTYSSLAGMVSDGFSTTEPAYLMASALLEQSPTVPSFKVIRGSTAAAQTMTFKVTDLDTGDSVGLQVIGVNGTVTNLYVTVTVGQTAIQIATAIAALTAPNGCTLASGGTDTVTITTTVAGKHAYAQSVKGGTFTDTTASASASTDLNNALTVDTSWYGISGEWQDATNIAAISSWAETNKRIHYYSTTDTNNLSASSGIGNTLKTDNYNYSYGAYCGSQSAYAGVATMANEFVRSPGTYTMAFKQLAGVPVDSLTDTQITNLEGNNLNYYTSVAGVSIIRSGKCASGMFVDLRRGIDALAAQIQIQVYTLLVNTPKVPYDPFGIAMVAAEMKSALKQFTASANEPAALLRNDPGFQPQVLTPDISSIPGTDIANRVLKNMDFTAYAQQATQTVQIQGTVNLT